MIMERAIEIFAIIQFVVIGLSHIVQHRAWAEFFIRLRGLGLPGVFMNGFLGLSFGSIVVAVHNVWSGPAMVLTIFGWLVLLKASISFVAPGVSMRALKRLSLERSWVFIPPGVVFLLMAGVLGFAQLSVAWK
jgi:hypothetical protein